MHKQFNIRRRFIKASLVVPLLGNMHCGISNANATSGNQFLIPENILNELVRIYGKQANNIISTDKFKLKVPEIAENGAVVQVSVTGEKDQFSSVAIFVVNNPKPLAFTCVLHEGSDLTVSSRIKLSKSSDIIAIALTDFGLTGVLKKVKVTIGCGGG